MKLKNNVITIFLALCSVLAIGCRSFSAADNTSLYKSPNVEVLA